MITSIQIANNYIDNLNAYNKPACKVGLALAIDDFVIEKTKALDEEIKEQKIHIENLQEHIQFLEGILDSRTAINNH